jgi:hypothetical protein
MSVIMRLTSMTTPHTNVIKIRMSVISTLTRLISTRRIRFPNADCEFTRRVWFPHLTRMRVNMKLTSVNMTITSVIMTRSSVIDTRRV